MVDSNIVSGWGLDMLGKPTCDDLKLEGVSRLPGGGCILRTQNLCVCNFFSPHPILVFILLALICILLIKL